MKRCESCRLEKPLSEFSRNRARPDGYAGWCKACFRIYYADWRTKNADRVKAAQREYCAVNAERQRAKAKAWAQDNPERKRNTDLAYRASHKGQASEFGRRWREINADRLRETKRRYRLANRGRINAANKEWRQNNRGTVLADRALRKARKRQATPPWLTEEQRAEMRELYKESARLSDETGIPHHVDHEIPLAGRNVCGLHVPWNLQILPAFVNLQKGNTA